MDSKKKTAKSAYVMEAVLAFEKMMAGNHRKMIDEINRANQGEVFVLNYLRMRNEPLLPSELSAALGSSLARVSALLNSLEKKGRIKRDINPNDRRNILVTITQDGEDYALEKHGHMQSCIAGLFEEMGEQDTRDFIRLAERFSELSVKHVRPSIKKEQGDWHESLTTNTRLQKEEIDAKHTKKV